MDNKDNFSFTYSAARQQEIENIRSKYLPRKEDKMDLLRRLDNSASQKAQSWSIAVGVVGALVMGCGMSMVMTEFGASLGQFATLIGIPVGIIGMIMIALAYPVYNRVLKRERERIAPEVLRLTDELLK